MAYVPQGGPVAGPGPAAPMGWGPTPYQGPQTTPGIVIAGFVLSFLCSLIGLILCIVGLKEIDKSEGRLGGRGLAVAGIWISIVMMVLGVAIQLSSRS